MKKLPILVKVSLVMTSLPMTSLEEAPILSEGFSGVVYFTVGYEQKDCNHIEDTGVESVKGISMFDSP